MTLRIQGVFILFFCALMAGACVTMEPGGEPGVALSVVPEFPAGRYLHAVQIDIPRHGSHTLQGVLRLADDGIDLVGLSPVGTTVFTIEDHFVDTVPKIEVFQEELRPHQNLILDFYRQLRPFLAGRRLGDAQKQLTPEGWVVRFYEKQKEATLPPTIGIRSDRFSLRIEVERYEPIQ